jgi:hypothetical protein
MRVDTNTPHINPAWSEAFLIEMRLQGVAGSQIGAALAEVEAHCAESGETAQDAFGDPASYAKALGLPEAPAQRTSLREELPSLAVGLGGMLMTLAAVGAWRSGTGVRITAGSLAVMAILGVGVLLIVRYVVPLMRAITSHRWLAIVFAFVPVAIFVGVLLLLGETVLFTLPMVPSLVVGMLALAASTFLALRRADALEDPVVGPEHAEGAGTLQMSPIVDRVGRGLTPWLFPLLTAVMCLPLLLV